MRNIILVLLVILSTTNLYAFDNSIVVSSGLEHTNNSNYDDSYIIQGRYEHRLYGNLFGGLDYQYHGGMSHNNEQGVSYGDVSGNSVLGDLIYYPNVSWKLKPYLLAGLGWSWWDFDNKTEVLVDLGDSFAYKVGVGTSYPINGSWSIISEWSFFKTDIPKHAVNPDGSDSVLLGDDHGKIGEEELCLTLGVKYSW